MDFSYNAPPVTTQKCELRQQQICGNSSVGRARPCQGRGREFESRFPLQNLKVLVKHRRTQAGIAQLVEHDLAKVGVASSSLVSRSKFESACYERRRLCGNSSVGRARPCQGRGREFESRFPLQFLSTVKLSTTNIALGHVLFRFRQILVNRLIHRAAHYSWNAKNHT